MKKTRTLLVVSLGFILVMGDSASAKEFNVQATRAFLRDVAASVQGGSIIPYWSDSGILWYVEHSANNGDALIQLDPQHPDRKTTIIDSSGLKRHLSEAGRDAPESLKIVELDLPRQRLKISANDQFYWVNLPEAAKAGRIAVAAQGLTAGIAKDLFPIQYQVREQLSPDASTLLSLSGDNAVLKSSAGSLTYLTRDGTSKAPWLLGGDILKPHGSEWSPAGDYVALRHYDMRDVDPWPIVRWLDAVPSVEEFRYFGKAGRPLPKVAIAAVNTRSQRLQRMRVAGGPDEYLAFLDWSHDSSELWFFRASRDYRRLDLLAGNAATGETRTVLTETRSDGGYVEFPYNGLRGLRQLGNGERFLWASDRNGWTHWYLYARSGRLIRQITQGSFDFGNILWLAEDATEMLVEARSDKTRPYDTHIWRVSLDQQGKATQLSTLPGQHAITPSPDGRWLLDYHHAPERPPRTDLLDADGSFVATLSEARIDTFTRKRWSGPELVKTLAADGKTVVHGMIFKPAGFDPTASYPVIERIYGGMQSQVIARGYFGEGADYPGAEYHLMLASMAAQGAVVVLLDSPGTPGRGRAYNMKTAATWPAGVVADHVSALRQLAASRPWMDLSRVCIEGNSWGGYMAIRALLEAPEFYHCAAASVPESSFHDHAAWIEIPLGTPTDNPSAYRNGSLLDKLDTLQGRLLIVAGTSDGNVGFSSNAKLLDALAQTGKPYDYVLFPQTNHAHQGRGDRYAYAVTRIMAFLQQQLTTIENQAH